MVFITCWPGDENRDMTGVYGYRNSRREFLYQHKDLKSPFVVTMDRRHVYVCNWKPPCIHEITESGQPLTIHKHGIQPSSRLRAIHWNQQDGLLYVTSKKSNVITRFRPEYSDHQGSEQDYRLQRLAKVLNEKQSLRDRAAGEETFVNSSHLEKNPHGTTGITDEEHVTSPQRKGVIDTNDEAHVAVEDNDTELLYHRSPHQGIGQDLSSTATHQEESHSVVEQRKHAQSDTFTVARSQSVDNITSGGHKIDPMKELIQLLQENTDKLKQDIDKTSPVSVWDFAGQYSFYTTHQTFLSRRAIYLLVSDVSGHITDLVDDDCYFDSEGIMKCRVHEMIEVWLNSIHTCAPSSEAGIPPVILKKLQINLMESETKTITSEVADFTLPTTSTLTATAAKEHSKPSSVIGSVQKLFKLQKTKGTVESTPVSSTTGANSLPAENQPKTEKKWKFWQRKRKNRERYRQVICERYFRDVRTYLSDKPTRFHLVNEDFAIDNTVVDKRLKDLKRKIVEVASQQSYWGEEIPTRWIPLEQELMRLKAAGIKVIPLSLVENLNQAGAVPIATQELDLFLRLQHDIGTILYFSKEVLKESVVLDPQWMIDALKSLITAEMFILRNNPAVADMWFDFKKNGKLSPELIDAIWTKENNASLLDNKGHILLLMEHLNIIAKPRCYSEDGSEIKVENYFLATCMLKETTPREVIFPKPQQDMESSSVLCYIFTGKFLPPPIFHRLLATCVSHWPIAKKKSENLIFCGCCVFKLDVDHKLTVFFKGYIIFARVTRIGTTEKTPSSKLCIEVREFITTTLTSVIGYLGQSLQFELSIQCPKSDGYSVDSMIPVADLQGNVEVPCDFHEESHAIRSHDVLKFWFQEEELSDDGFATGPLSSPATSDTDMFMRMAYLLVDVGSQVLRRLFHHHTVTPTCTLDQYLANNRKSIDGLYNWKTLNQSQMDIMFPSSGSTNLEDYDITLLSLLFTHIVRPLSKKEKKLIKSLKEDRNEMYSHASSCKMNINEYQACWNSVTSTLMSLSKLCGDPNFENQILLEIQRIQVTTVPAGSYLNILRTWFNRIETVEDELQDLKLRFEAMEGSITKL